MIGQVQMLIMEPDGIASSRVSSDILSNIIIGRNRGMLMSKGGKKGIWSGEYGSSPNPATVDWGKSDSQLADALSRTHNDPKRAPTSANNRAKKWFNSKRPKR